MGTWTDSLNGASLPVAVPVCEPPRLEDHVGAAARSDLR
jgi:hypothetical protein